MANNSLIKYKKENLFSKIFSKIKMLFIKKDIGDDLSTKSRLEDKKNDEPQSSFITNIRINDNITNTNQKRKELMRKLSKNPELLRDFSPDKLEKILQWYREENNQKRVSLGRTTKKDKEQAKKIFMKEICTNPKLLNGFSNDRLKKILDWYKKENDKKRFFLNRHTKKIIISG